MTTTFSSANTQSVRRSTTFFHSLAFVVGFGVVFTLLGTTAGLLGRTLLQYQLLIQQIGAVLLVIFGLTTMGVFFRLETYFGRNPSPLNNALVKLCHFFNMLLYTERRLTHMEDVGRGWGYASSFAVGVSFSAGWVPCIGPILASILLLAGNSATAGQGALLLAVYSIGLGIPFLLTGLAFSRATAMLRKLNRYLGIVSFISGVFLLIMGYFLWTNTLIDLVGQFAFLNEIVFELEGSITSALGVQSVDASTINSLNAAPIALLAGALSFISPCVLPLVPAYIGYLSGTTLQQS